MAERKKHNTKRVNIDQAFIFFCQPTEEGRLKSHEDVAKHFGVTRPLISKWASKHDWSKRREEWGKELVEKSHIVVINEVEKATQRHIKGYISLEAFATEILQRQADAFHGKQAKDPSAPREKFSVWAVSEAAKILKDAINGQRVILGLPIDIAKAELSGTGGSLALPEDQIEEFDTFISQNGTKKPLRPLLNPPVGR